MGWFTIGTILGMFLCIAIQYYQIGILKRDLERERYYTAHAQEDVKLRGSRIEHLTKLLAECRDRRSA